jgi:hypothetical protein
MAVCLVILRSEDVVSGRLFHHRCGMVVLGCDRFLRWCDRRGTGPPDDRFRTGPNCGAPTSSSNVEPTNYR